MWTRELDVEHRSHQDGRAREPDLPDCTVYSGERRHESQGAHTHELPGACDVHQNGRMQKRRRRWQAREHWIPRLRRPLTQRALISLSTVMLSRGRSLPWCEMLAETASCRAASVLTSAQWILIPTVSRTKTVPRCFLSCEAETARDTHLRVASSSATSTIGRG